LSKKYPSIPEPSQEVRSLQVTVMALKEAVEMLTGQRGTKPVEWEDLVRLGVVEASDVPR
jgi:hypothetical protein